MRPDRQGIHVFVLVLVLVLLSFLAALIQAQRSNDMWFHSKRLATEQVDRDVLASAVTEVTHAFMRDCNRVSSPLAAALRRRLPDMVLPVRLTYTTAPRGTALEAEVRLVGREPYATDDSSEWQGTLEVVARLIRADGRPARRELSHVRELRAVRPQVPAPLDRFDLLDWRSPIGDQPIRAFDMELTAWQARAALRLEPGTADVTAAFNQLTNRLGGVSGVVRVANKGAAPLVLRDYVHHGRAVLVVEGPLRVADIRIADPAQDALTIVAYGDLEVSGTLDATLVLTHGEGERPARRRLAPGTLIRGAFINTSGDYEAEDGFALDGRLPNRADAYISVSPHLLASREMAH